MVKEIEDHSKNGHWKRVLRNTIGDTKTVKAIWSFKRKCRPNGSLLKHKIRLCIHRGVQTYGENYWDTYAPVVNWVSIRVLLAISKLLNMHTRSMLKHSLRLMQM